MNLEDQIRNIPDLKIRLERYMELQGGRTVSIKEVCDILQTDILVSDIYLEQWAAKHDNDCSTLSTNPREVRVYSTILKDPLIQAQKEIRQKKIIAKKKYLDARREWNEF